MFFEIALDVVVVVRRGQDMQIVVLRDRTHPTPADPLLGAQGGITGIGLHEHVEATAHVHPGRIDQAVIPFPTGAVALVCFMAAAVMAVSRIRSPVAGPASRALRWRADSLRLRGADSMANGRRLRERGQQFDGPTMCRLREDENALRCAC
jgi:hypothetical protein